MKRCYDIGLSKVKLERCGITNLLVCHWSPIYTTFFNDSWERWNASLIFSCAFSFFSEKCPWEIFALRCSPACSIRGVIWIHFKPCLSGICQHSESFSKGSRLCGFPGSTHWAAPSIGVKWKDKQWELEHWQQPSALSCAQPEGKCWQALPLSTAALLHRAFPRKFHSCAPERECSGKGNKFWVLASFLYTFLAFVFMEGLNLVI